MQSLMKICSKIISYTAYWFDQPKPRHPFGFFVLNAPHLRKFKCIYKYAKSSSISDDAPHKKNIRGFLVFFLFLVFCASFGSLWKQKQKEKNLCGNQHTHQKNHLCGLINFMVPCNVIRILFFLIENVILCDWRESIFKLIFQ